MAMAANRDARLRELQRELAEVLEMATRALARARSLEVEMTAVMATGGASACVRPERDGGGELPTFRHVSQTYIDMRVAAGAATSELSQLRLRRQTFLDVIGDRRVDAYYPRDLQDYVIRMSRWPANVTKRIGMSDLTTKEILEANAKGTYLTIRLKTLRDGYVANVRTMMRAGMADHDYRDPFAGVVLRWPKHLAPSPPREGIPDELLDQVLRRGAASGLLDEALLPLLARLTGRRIGLLIYLRGEDIREKHGVAVARTDGIVFSDGRWRRVPVKTRESLSFFVLHEVLHEIGFVGWARRREGWIFAEAHQHPDPSRYVSKAMSRLLARCGARGGAETFHSLRGDAIAAMREAGVRDRDVRLQAGHELGDEHDRYGRRTLEASACQAIASMPLAKVVRWAASRELDFDVAADTRRRRGRRVKAQGR